MRGKAQRDGCPGVGWVETTVLLCRLRSKVHHIRCVCTRMIFKSPQRHFPIKDILFFSGDISDQIESCQKSCREIDVLGCHFGGSFPVWWCIGIFSSLCDILVGFSVSTHGRHYANNNWPWVGQNYGPIFSSVCWPKYTKLGNRAREVCKTVFWFTISLLQFEDIWNKVAKSRR